MLDLGKFLEDSMPLLPHLQHEVLMGLLGDLMKDGCDVPVTCVSAGVRIVLWSEPDRSNGVPTSTFAAGLLIQPLRHTLCSHTDRGAPAVLSVVQAADMPLLASGRRSLYPRAP